MVLRQLLARVSRLDEWEGHYDYCDVFKDNWPAQPVASGRPCSEDCANHPGSKFLLGKFSGRVREP